MLFRIRRQPFNHFLNEWSRLFSQWDNFAHILPSSCQVCIDHLQSPVGVYEQFLESSLSRNQFAEGWNKKKCRWMRCFEPGPLPLSSWSNNSALDHRSQEHPLKKLCTILTEPKWKCSERILLHNLDNCFSFSKSNYSQFFFFGPVT